ncbi:hypothetical protein ACQ143_03370 [Microbacterium sp. MC2]
MGLFQQRPEEPTAWAGLPAEPHEPASPVERLGDAPPVDIPLLGPLTATETVAITIEPVSVDTVDADGE